MDTSNMGEVYCKTITAGLIKITSGNITTTTGATHFSINPIPSGKILLGYTTPSSTEYVQINGDVYINSNIRVIGDVVCSEIVALSPYGNCYFTNNATATVLSNTNVYYKVNIVSTTGSSTFFSHSGTSRLTYTGNRNLRTLVSISISINGGGNNRDYTFSAAKNGANVLSSEQTVRTLNSTFRASFVVQCILLIQQNDYVELFVKNISNTNNITVTNMNMTVARIESTL